MIRTRFLAASCLALCTATTILAQTLDVAQLPGGISVTITRLAQDSVQVLSANGNELLRAHSITVETDLIDAGGQTAGLLVQAASQDPACPALPYALTVQFDQPWLRGPLGRPCTAYAAATYPGGAILFSVPQLHADGDAMLFDLQQGYFRLGPIAFAPQPDRGWDALDGEVGGYNDLSPLDLYAAQPVYEDLADMWGETLFVFAQHLASRTAPIIQGNVLLQTGCLPSQCAFAIGMLAVDPANEAIYAAYFNEGAPDARPAIEDWPEEARAIYERWRAGDYR